MMTAAILLVILSIVFWLKVIAIAGIMIFWCELLPFGVMLRVRYYVSILRLTVGS